MINGEYHEGLLLERNDQFVILENSNGKFKLFSENIKKIEQYTYSGLFQYPKSQDTRYFIAPSAIPLKKGQGTYSNILITTNAVNYGISNNISIGVATELVNSLIDHNPLWIVNAKAGFRIAENLHVAGGVFWTHQGYISQFSTREKKTELIAFIPFTLITLGYSESNVSLGISYSAFEKGYLDSKGFIVSLSGVQRASDKISLITENNFGFLNEGLNYFGFHGMQLHYKRNNFRFGFRSVQTLDFGVFLSPFFLEYSTIF